MSANVSLSWGKKLVFAIVTIVGLLVLVEAASRSLRANLPSYWNYRDRLTNAAYTSKPWFSEGFLQASFVQPGGWHTPEGTRLILPRDYSDRYFTVTGGVRKTTGFVRNPRVPFGGRICIFGGSTTYCSEVPDDLTWPSQLQNLINKAVPDAQFEVINYGVTSVNSYQELERQRLELSRGDAPALCIFLNGANDVIQGVVCKQPRGTIYETLADREARWTVKIRRRLAFVDLAAGEWARLKRNNQGDLPDHLQNAGIVSDLVKQTSENYEKNMRDAASACAGRGCQVFVFLQPGLYTIDRPLTAHETEVLSRCHVAYGHVFKVTYPALRDAIGRLKESGLAAHDASGILDANRAPIFLDAFHVESAGNAIIAEYVAGIIGPSLSEAARKATGH
ncbi:MAG: hypothetical protein HY913_13430 [Desulfomonile tiedjei]|nr:hypothetical protein [Desulfomonile tiedjei]